MSFSSEKSIQKQNQQIPSSKMKKGSQSTLPLIDRRSEASAQLYFQKAANNSPQAKSLDVLQKMAGGKEDEQFKAIAAASAPGTLDDINVAGGNLPGTASLDLGTTDIPQNAIAPTFHVQLVPANRRGTRFRAIVTKPQDADEGNVNSMYVKGGTYYTNYRWMPDQELISNNLNPANVTPNNRITTLIAMQRAINWDHVYMNVSSSVANLSRDAEHEHLNDIREAYRISLGALDQAIDTVVAQMPQNGYTPDGGGTGYVSLQAARNDTFSRINRLLPQGPRGNISSNQGTWMNEYLRLAQMTQNRDNQGWHSFILRKSGFWYNNSVIKAITEAWDIYAEHPETLIQYVDIIQGPQMQINQTPSNAVIHF
jgi:hypothetical protein